MQKAIKRTLSVLLAVLLTVTLFAVALISASAAEIFQEEGAIALGETKSVTLAAGSSGSNTVALWEFTPNETMIVSFYSTANLDTVGYLYNASREQITSDDESGEGSNFRIVYELTGNTTYYFGAQFYHGDSSGTFEVTLEKPETKTIRFVSNGAEQGHISIVDINGISTENIPVPTNGAEGKAFTGYTYGEKECFHYSHRNGFSYQYNITEEDFTDGELTLNAVWVDGPVFLGTNVTLDSVIRLNLYFDTKGYGDNFSVYATDLDTDTVKEGSDRIYYMKNDYTPVDGSENTYRLSVDVYAKEIADNIEVEITCGDVSVCKVTSVKEYLETLAANAETYAPTGKADALQNLCYATLRYGAAAQKQFAHYGNLSLTGGRNLPLADENVPASYTATAVPAGLTVDSGSQEDYSDYRLSYYASSLGLFSDTSYAICFEDLDEDGYTSVAVYRGDEECNRQRVGEASYTTTDGEGYEYSVYHPMYAYIIPGIAAGELFNDITLTFRGSVNGHYDNNDSWVDGYDLPEKEFTFNPQTYIVKVLTQAGVDPDYANGALDPTYDPSGTGYNTKEEQTMANLVVTVKAIYDYSTRAAAYFG